jgi:hypothetical protein
MNNIRAERRTAVKQYEETEDRQNAHVDKVI